MVINKACSKSGCSPSEKHVPTKINDLCLLRKGYMFARKYIIGNSKLHINILSTFILSE
jgi:hypothetical protein